MNSDRVWSPRRRFPNLNCNYGFFLALILALGAAGRDNLAAAATTCLTPGDGSNWTQALSFCKGIIDFPTKFATQDGLNESEAILAAVAMAKEAEKEAERTAGTLESFLRIFDCSRPYSLHTCNDCRKAYKRWSCLTYLHSCEKKKPCIGVCHEVLQACPRSVGFACPRTTFPFRFKSDYASSDCLYGGTSIT